MKCLISWWHLSFGEEIENVYVDGSMQDSTPSLANALEIQQFCTESLVLCFAQNPFLEPCLYNFLTIVQSLLNRTIMVLLRNTHTKRSSKRQPRRVCCLCYGHFTNAWHGATPCKTIDIGMQFSHGESFCTPVISLEERQNYMASYSIKGRARTIAGSYWFVTPM